MEEGKVKTRTLANSARCGTQNRPRGQSVGHPAGSAPAGAKKQIPHPAKTAGIRDDTAIGEPSINRMSTESVLVVGLAAHESIEILEAHTYRPLVEGTCYGVLKARRIVFFAEPRCGITVFLQDFSDGAFSGPIMEL